MKEKIILSIIAALLGLLVAGGAFYIYQMTRTIDTPEKTKPSLTKNVTPTPQNTNFLIVDNPKDEIVSDKKILSISGKTTPDTTIVVSNESTDQIITSSNNGDFILTQTLDTGINVIHILAIFQNGEEQSVTRTVTYTTEEF